MACVDSIKLFQFNQKYCELIGIKLPRSNQQHTALNCKNFIFIICSTQLAIALFGFLLTDAKSMDEYAVIFFTLTDLIQTMVAYFVLIWKLENVSKFIENCEQFIEKSMWELQTKNRFFFKL